MLGIRLQHAVLSLSKLTLGAWLWIQAVAHRDVAYEDIMGQPQVELQALAEAMHIAKQVCLQAQVLNFALAHENPMHHFDPSNLTLQVVDC